MSTYRESEKKLIEFLSDKRSKSEKRTITIYGEKQVLNGSYLIPEDKQEEFYSLLMEQKNTLQIIEAPTEYTPLYIDIDIKYKISPYKDDRSIDLEKNHHIDIIDVFIKSINKNTNCNEIPVLFQMREIPYYEKDFIKDGIHILFPELLVSKNLKRKILNDAKKIWDEEIKIETIDNNEAIDINASLSNGWFIHAVGNKTKKPKYKLIFAATYILNETETIKCNFYPTINNDIKINIDTLDVNLIKYLSYRKKYKKVYDLIYNEPVKILEDKAPMDSTLMIEDSKLIETIPNEKIYDMTGSLNTDDLILILNNLKKDYYEDYKLWLNICYIFKNENYEYTILDNWSKKSIKYDYAKNKKIYDNLKTNSLSKKLTQSSLYYYLKLSNEIIFRDLIEKKYNIYGLIKTCTDLSLTDLFNIITSNNYIFEILRIKKTKNFYILNEYNVWSECDIEDLGEKLTEKIQKELIIYFEKLKIKNINELNKISSIKNELNTSNKQLLSSQINYIDKCIKYIGHETTLYRIYNKILKKYKRIIDEEQFFNISLFSCLNKTFDMNYTDETKTNIIGWRDINPEDYVLDKYTTKFNYFPSNESCKKEIIDYFYSIFAEKDIADFDLRTIARSLYGTNSGNQHIYLHVGEGSNSKSLKQSLISNTFGFYYKELKSEIFIKKNKDLTGEEASPELVSIEGGRIVMVSEMPEKKFDVELIKKLTSTEKISARPLYKGKKLLDPCAYTGGTCNILPGFNDQSNGFARRTIVIYYPFSFVDKESYTGTNPMEKLKDESLQEKFMELKYKCAFLEILTNIYIENYVISKEVINIPLSVKLLTNSYNKDNDPVLKWIEEHYTIITSDHVDYNKTKIQFKTLYEYCKLTQTEKITDKALKKTLTKLEMQKTGVLNEVNKVSYYYGLLEIK